MGNDYIPAADADFDNWLGRFAAYAKRGEKGPGANPSAPPLRDEKNNCKKLGY